jgi:DNA-binding PadR family transcriptional regulator
MGVYVIVSDWLTFEKNPPPPPPIYQFLTRITSQGFVAIECENDKKKYYQKQRKSHPT